MKLRKNILIFVLIYLALFNNYSYGEELNLSGKSYILIDEVSGRILAGKNINDKMSMASTTKIMTALVALENGNLDDMVKIGEESTNIEGSSLYLKPNENMPLVDLLYGLMLRSGNDAAIAIANHISGSEEVFIDLMNIKAKSIGADNTNFENPHGLTSKNHYSTAYDMAIITKEAFKMPGFSEIASAKNYKGSREEYNYYINKNKTLWDYKDGDGVKIGYTMDAGRCLVSSAKRNEMRLIAVSLNAPNWFNDNYKLFDYGFENFKPYILFNEAQFITNVTIPNGRNEKLPLVTENEFVYPLNEEEKESIKFKINLDKDLVAPIDKNKVLGNLEVYLEGVLIKTENLVAKTNMDKKSLLQTIIDKIKPNK
jgi:D-alanyl-D-alanine carboxypeptidase (penicillin-binding protein 5/6)